MVATHRCPVCGYDGLHDRARSGPGGGGSYEICISCGFQFGVSDEDYGHTFESWRARWTQEGVPWSSSNPPPADWDAGDNLQFAKRDPDPWRSKQVISQDLRRSRVWCPRCQRGWAERFRLDDRAPAWVCTECGLLWWGPDVGPEPDSSLAIELGVEWEPGQRIELEPSGEGLMVFDRDT